jgi:hypothetical protein
VHHQHSPHRHQEDISLTNRSPGECLKSLALTPLTAFIGTNCISQIEIQVFSTHSPTLSLLRVRLTPDIPKNPSGYEQVIAYPHSVDVAHTTLSAIFSRFHHDPRTSLPLVSSSELRDLIEDAKEHNQSSRVELITSDAFTEIRSHSAPSKGDTTPLRFPKRLLSSIDELLNDTLRYSVCVEWYQKVLAEVEIARAVGSRPQAHIILHVQDGADIIKPLRGSPFRDLAALKHGIAELTDTIFLSVQDELDRANEHTGAARILEAIGESLGLSPHISTLLPPPLFAESTFNQLQSDVHPATAAYDTSTFTLLTYAQRLDDGGVFCRPVMNVMIIGCDQDTQMFRLQLTVPNLRSIAGSDDPSYLRSQVVTWLAQPETTARCIVNSTPSTYQATILRAMRKISQDYRIETPLSFGVLPSLMIDESNPYVTSPVISSRDRGLRMAVAEALLNQGTPVVGSRFDTVIAAQAAAIAETNLANTWRVQAIIGEASSFLHFQNPLGATISLRGEGLECPLTCDATPESLTTSSNDVPQEHREAQEIEKRRFNRAHTLLCLASMLDAPPELLLHEARKLATTSITLDTLPSPLASAAYNHAGRFAALWLHLLQSEGFLSPSEARNLLRHDPTRLFMIEFLDDGRCLLKLAADGGISSGTAVRTPYHHTICVSKDGVESVWLTAPSRHPASGELSSMVRTLTRRGIQFTKRDGGPFSESEISTVLLVLAEPHSKEDIVGYLQKEAPTITVSERSFISRTIRERISRWLRRFS